MLDPTLDAAMARALSRLRDPESPMLARAVDIAVGEALARTLREVIDAERVVALTVASLDEVRVRRALAEIVRPAQDRQRKEIDARGDTLAAWLPAEAAVVIGEIAEGTRPPRGAWARELVDPADVRELLAPVLQETLLAFARKLPMVGGVEEGRAGKLLGGLARGFAQGASERAQKIADIGRGVLGGIGAEMEKRVHGAARDFSHGAVEPLRDTFAERLTSDEGTAILARMRKRAIGVILGARAADLLDDLDAAPRLAVDQLIAKTIAHDLARPEVQGMLRSEVETFLAAREGMTIGALLDEWGSRADVEREARRILGIVARAAVDGDDVEVWLRDLLSE